MEEQIKPSIDEVLKYATPQVRKFISKAAGDLPKEQKEEIEQECYVRLIQAYPGIDASLGWKSFVYNHSRGTVLDYLRFGKGFHEQRWSVAKEEPEGSKNTQKIRERLRLDTSDGEDMDIDKVLGAAGAFTEMSFDRIHIRWELVARMASQDESLHAFAKSLLGIGIEEMAPVFGLCRARVGQLIQAFVERFDSPELADCPWFKQTCFAFGICDHLGMPDVDQSDVLGFSVGWRLPEVNLEDLTPCLQIREERAQLGFLEDEP